MFEAIQLNLATKNDLENLENRLSSQIKQLELKMTIKLGSLLVLFLGLSTLIDKAF